MKMWGDNVFTTKDRKKQIKDRKEKISNVLIWFGSIATVIGIILYLILVATLIEGFEYEVKNNVLVMFSILGGIIGVYISTALRVQGIDFARSIPEVKDILDQFNRKTKEKHRSITYHMLVNFVIDVLVKASGVAFSSYFMIHIFIKGLGDWRYFGVAVAQVMIFVGFGLLSMRKAFNHYLDDHVPMLLKKLGDKYEHKSE